MGKPEIETPWPALDVEGADPRIAVAAEALHNARRPHLEQMGRHMFSRNRLIEMWPEYQLQIRSEAQAVIWALDKHGRQALGASDER